MWKRVSAFLFDGILLGILTVGFAFIFSTIFRYDNYNKLLNEAYAGYEAKYGIVFEITEEQYNSMSAEESEKYNSAYAELIADSEAMYAYNMVVNLTLVITTLSILFSYALLEFVVPLLLGNGQTLGKKVFGIGVMRTDGIRVTPPLLFIRTILGKFTIETMIPVLILLMIYFNTIGIVGTLILGLILLLQIILLIATDTNSLIHDLLAKTVVIDLASQMIFADEEEMIAYKKKVHAEKAARQTY
ncbi:MAG: RDD family protein [Lachnospiraceae bacterium]